MNYHTQTPLPSPLGLSIREAALIYVGDPPQTESPLERLKRFGAGALSTAELLALLGLSLPDAQHLVAKVGSLLNLARSSSNELVKSPGVGPALAARIQAAVELGKRVFAKEGEDAAPRIQSPADAFYLLQDMALLEQEEMRVVTLNTKNDVIRVVTLYRGTVNSSPSRVAEILRVVIQDNAPAFILGHNHPSGDASPSPEDVMVTRKLAEAWTFSIT
jgi:DNA repair protein RadC